MIRVAVCDDDIKTVRKIENYLQLKNEQLSDEKLEVSTFSSGVEFLRATELGSKFHIVFMDLNMGELDGVDVGKILREQPDGDDVLLIYISIQNTHYEAIASVGFFRFIKKPIKSDKLAETFDRALSQAFKSREGAVKPNYFKYKSYTDTRYIKTDEIVYIKHYQHKIDVYTWDNSLHDIVSKDTFYGKLAEATASLPKNFIRCHSSYVVNLNYVQAAQKVSLLLRGKATLRIPISAPYRLEVKDAYFAHMEEAI